MASRNLNDLNTEFRQLVIAVVEECKVRGIDMLVYCTLRTPLEQAILWRQSRSTSTINNKLNSLEKAGLWAVAEVIRKVGPQHGRHVTNAVPGQSWHNYGEAADAVPLVNGNAAWNDRNAYNVYGTVARECNLTWGGDWSKLRDLPHIQFRQETPFKYYNIEEINNAMREYL